MKTTYFEIEKINYGSLYLKLNSGDGDDYAGCKLEFGCGTINGLIRLPPIIKPKATKVFPKWDSATVTRLGRDYYFKYIPKNYGISFCDTYFNITYGIQSYDSDIKSQSIGWFVPWLTYTYLGITYFNIDGSIHKWIPSKKDDFELTREAQQEVSKAAFLVKDFDGELVTAICHIQERQWHRGTNSFSWLKYLMKNQITKSLDIEFSTGIGKRKASWKGGITGHSIELLENEFPVTAMKRYCEKYDLTFVKQLTDLPDDVKSKFEQRFGKDCMLI